MTERTVEILNKIWMEKNTLGLEQIFVEFDQIQIFVQESPESERVLKFASELAENHQCIIKLSSRKSEILLMVNEHYNPQDGIEITIK